MGDSNAKEHLSRSLSVGPKNEAGNVVRIDDETGGSILWITRYHDRWVPTGEYNRSSFISRKREQFSLWQILIKRVQLSLSLTVYS